ncbi:MAG: efflux RND transporter permease subunit [Bdellovibrionales bacterium]
MNWIYSKPKIVSLLLGLFVFLGIFSSFQLPIALYPNSSKPKYRIAVRLNDLTPVEYINKYNDSVEASLKKIENLDQFRYRIQDGKVKYDLEFEWNTSSREVERALALEQSKILGKIPGLENWDVWYWKRRANGGRFMSSFFKADGNLAAIRPALEAGVIARVKALPDVHKAFLWDPTQKAAFIELKPDYLLRYGLKAPQISWLVKQYSYDKKLGSIVHDTNFFQVEMSKGVEQFEDLEDLSLRALGKPHLRLKDVAEVKLEVDSVKGEIIRTNGRPSVFLKVEPTEEANLRAMVGSVKTIINDELSHLPPDVSNVILVDPSRFINSSISNISEQIVFGGLIAVLILMLFVGSFKNSIFSLIEIPIAMILSFILMRLFGISINLISLGGLALTAGMNIDSSVVMVENILRHLRTNPPNNFNERISTILKAVNEVRIPIIVSCLSTLIVFFPLISTNGLAQAVLGDLARAVIFSHGFSMLVALIVVPIVRIYLIRSNPEEKPSNIVFKGFQSFYLLVEDYYRKTLNFVLSSSMLSIGILFSISTGTLVTILVVAPKIKTELVKLPKTDTFWIRVEHETTSTTRELAAFLRPIERMLMEDHSNYTKSMFTEIWDIKDGGMVLTIKDKSKMDEAKKVFEKALSVFPGVSFKVWPWNPSKLPVPNPPKFQMFVSGSNDKVVQVTQNIKEYIDENKEFNWSSKDVRKSRKVLLEPKKEYLENYLDATNQTMDSLQNQISYSLEDQNLGTYSTNEGSKPVNLRFPSGTMDSPAKIGSFPLQFNELVMPLRALFDINIKESFEGFAKYENAEQLRIVGDPKDTAKDFNQNYIEKIKSKFSEAGVTIGLVEGSNEKNKALREVGLALGTSLLLIFILIYIQFGRLKDVLIVMLSFPLGLVGVCISLYTFDSSWSINSGLGLILLAGISVNNSILLVSFFHQVKDDFKDIKQASIHACKTRLKPILVTSLTTILAMLPVAFGRGDGGEVLQSLGIAVSSGMLISTFLTLIVVPCLLNLSYGRASA